jgi:acetyl coenzyme A synthetase (ADP forming)-like protein
MTPTVRHLLTPTQDAEEAGRVLLRDGSAAEVRPATPLDQPALLEFFHRLAPESRMQRFHTASIPGDDLIGALCDDRDPASLRTLIVRRLHDGAPRIVATGTYARKERDVAEVAFAVDDDYRGKGLGTVLLERLALLAAREGFRRFWAVTRFDNPAMRDVFRDSGFTVRESLKGGEVEVDFSVVPDAAAVARFELRDCVATVASLRPFFVPNAVAVVGASRDPGSIGHRTMRAVVEGGFRGPIFPVNPKADAILGHTAYPSVCELPQQVDLAVIAVPRAAVLGVVVDCAARGVRAVVVITAGFAEVHGDGPALQQALLEKVRGHGMRLIGPNCLGLLNADPAVSLNASFSPVFPPPGRVAMSSQSGALGLAVLDAAARLRLGFSTFVSVGNKADVSGNDLLQYWEDDPNTGVILLYLESFGNPRRFARVARRVSGKKPIVAIKGGRGTSGARAAGSHTAALAAKDVAVEALFRQTGVIRADTLEEMFDLAAALGAQPLPAGKRVGIVTNAGGPGILCADACEAAGLVIPEFSEEMRARLGFLPAAASVGNPVDMIASASPDEYARTVEAVLTSADVDALIVIYIPVGLGDPAAYSAAIHRGVADARSRGGAGKPVLGCWMSDPALVPAGSPAVEHVPNYAFPEAPARVLGKIAAYARWREQPAGDLPDFADIDLAVAKHICREALAAHGPGWLSARATLDLLRAMKLPAAGGVAADEEEAVRLAERVGFPVALKLASRTLTHKTEVGGVRLNLADAAAVRQAFADIRGAAARAGGTMDGALVQPMLKGGTEVVVGMTLDPAFGPLIAFGLGGVLIEVLHDVCFRLAPLTTRDADEMLTSIRGYKLLQGYRGQPAADVEALKIVLLRVSRLAEEVPEIAELDLNPVFAREMGCAIADARVRVQAAGR